jgi:hypothetical protein
MIKGMTGKGSKHVSVALFQVYILDSIGCYMPSDRMQESTREAYRKHERDKAAADGDVLDDEGKPYFQQVNWDRLWEILFPSPETRSTGDGRRERAENNPRPG